MVGKRFSVFVESIGGRYNAGTDFDRTTYFQTIPKELDEAAKVDGAGWFRIYRTVIMPLSGPAIATVAILNFIAQHVLGQEKSY